MAYPFYQPFYQPYYQNQQQNNSGIIWVSGINEAQMYPVAPNNAVPLWEQSGRTIYLKQADATGKPSMRIFDITERTESPNINSSAPDVKTADFATKDELAAIVGAVKGISSDIEQMKGDLYGVAGKRKKKVEVEDDE